MAKQTKKETELKKEDTIVKEQETKQDDVVATEGAANAEAGAVAEPPKPEPVMLSTGKWAVGPTTTIHCVDCGAERIIKIQDAFQVTRCAACQKKAQNKKRAQKKKEKNRAASLEKRLAEARALLAEHDTNKAEGQE